VILGDLSDAAPSAILRAAPRKEPELAAKLRIADRGVAAGGRNDERAHAPGSCLRGDESPSTIETVSTEFLVTSLVIVATPGTGALFTIAAGLGRGAYASLVAAFACTLGTLPHMLAAITGLAALLHTSAVAFEAVKYIGVAYLLYMAWATLKERGPLTVEESAPRSARQVIVSGVLVNLLNPKLTIFFFAFLPLFVGTGERHVTLRMVELSLVFMLLTFVVFVGYGLFAASVRHYVLARPPVVSWMRRTFAGAFAILAGRLAVTER